MIQNINSYLINQAELNYLDTSLVCVQESYMSCICLDSSRDTQSAAFLYHEENLSNLFFMSGLSATVFIK